MDSLLSLLRQKLPQMEILENEPMRRHCSFRIGGPCRGMLLPRREEELSEALTLLEARGISPLVIGNGTNLLVTDEPLERIVIKTEGLQEITPVGDAGLRAGAGVSLARLALAAEARGLTGLEFAHGIPGTLGGAAIMNAGAYGGEMKDVLVSADCADPRGGRLSLEGEALGLGYRSSAFEALGLTVLGCTLSLQPGDRQAIRGKMTELMEKRRASQPLDKPSAGSTFKRPASGYAAAMIDQAGLKGCRIGDAAVSEKHAGFVVNLGQARFEDVLALMALIQERVEKAFGLRLEPELRIIR